MSALIKIFLTVVGLLYVALGVWCAAAPATTSKKVGLERINESGRSEFFTVYGGLEVGLGATLIVLAAQSSTLSSGLIACLLIHGGLVLFRAISFSLYDAMKGLTLNLAIGEWVIFLASLALLIASRRS